MKILPLALGAFVLLSGCNQTAPVTSGPAVAPPAAGSATRVDSVRAIAPVPAAPPVVSTPGAPVQPPVPPAAATLELAFAFKPTPDPDDPGHPKTSAHLLLQGARPQDIDLGKFAGRPDVVDATKAKQADFPPGMLLGFRSYEAASGTSFDLAVLPVDGRHLRIVRRRVTEAAATPGPFETAREISVPANTRLKVAPSAK